MPDARPPTLRSLAYDLGLSISTVSRALNGHPHVDDAVRVRVLEAAKRSGYVPDPLARGLKTQRTWRVGLVLPDILNEFYTVAVASPPSRPVHQIFDAPLVVRGTTAPPWRMAAAVPALADGHERR
ncbi:MAG: LacI family DNA-binding transcriptional regulator [Chloroflexi bacterium]|nr:LacI family DNA-binding transcriptional regulator [Chloroflexota bacterium]